MCRVFVCSCVAALLGGHVILTDLPDRLRLLRKNVELNLGHGSVKGSATVVELVWGDDPGRELIEPLPDFGNGLVLRLLIVIGFDDRMCLRTRIAKLKH